MKSNDLILSRLIQPWLVDAASTPAALLFSVQMAVQSACKAAHQLLLLAPVKCCAQRQGKAH